MVKWTLPSMIVVVGTLLTPTPTAHSLQSPRKYLVVMEETIDPSMTAAYEEGVRLTIAAMHKAKLGPEWNWSTSQRNHTYSYVFSFASIEEASTAQTQQRLKGLIDAIGEDAQRAAELATPALRGSRSLVLEFLEDSSYLPANSAVKEPKFIHVDLVRAKADMIDHHRGVISRVIASMHQANSPIPLNGYRVVIGDGGTLYGEGRTFYYAGPFESFSQYYDEYSYHAAMKKALGKEGAKQLAADLMKSLEAFDIYDAVVRPDLSYRNGRETQKARK